MVRSNVEYSDIVREDSDIVREDSVTNRLLYSEHLLHEGACLASLLGSK